MSALIVLVLLAPAPALAQSDMQLRYVCNDFVTRSLPDPRDAKLEWGEAPVAKRKDGLYSVTVRGRVRNQFGALQFAAFECVIRHQGGDNFSAESIHPAKP